MTRALRPRFLALLAVLSVAVTLRGAGLLRGLESGHVFHPDAPKQMVALSKYLHGEYAWHYGSLFYDGYPYGLNRLDAWILRPLLRVQHWLKSNLEARNRPYAYPPRGELYPWVLALRVAYGTIVVLFAWWMGTHLWGGVLRPAAVALAVALAPLPTVVAHAATGDVGVDLFSAATLGALCQFYRSGRRVRWLAVAAACVGFGFACKYQAALAGLALAAVLLHHAASGERPVLVTARGALGAAAGGGLGVVAGIPALLVNPSRTWRDVVANFFFLRDYNIPADFRRMPWLERAWHGLGLNLPRIVVELGVILVGLSLLGAGVALHRVVGRAALTGAAREREAIVLSAFFFAAAALLLSTAMKPVVQPFHFSYLTLPFALVAVHASTARPPWRHGRGLVLLACLAPLLELAHSADSEIFFWRRPGSHEIAGAYAHDVMVSSMSTTDREPRGPVLKHFFLEPEWNPAIFRNPRFSVSHADAAFWNAIHLLPAPMVPFGGEQSWIFANGPVFPRSDHLFEVPANSSVAKDVVLYGDVRPIRLGLSSRRLPTKVVVDFGGVERGVPLPPHSRRVVVVDPIRWRNVAGAGPGGADVRIVPLRATTKLGEAVVGVLSDEREVEQFEAFNGGDVAPLAARFDDREAASVLTHAAETLFVEPVEPRVVTLLRDGVPLAAENVVLPAGRYLLTCAVELGGVQDVIEMSWGDRDGLSRFSTTTRRYEFEATESGKPQIGSIRVVYSFAKPLAPTSVNFRVASSSGKSRIVAWSLRPDFERLWNDLAVARRSETAPEWSSPQMLKVPHLPRHSVDVDVGNDLRMTAYSFPHRLEVGEHFRHGVSFEPLRYGIRDFDKLYVFVHLIDARGRIRAAFDYELERANFDPQLWNPIDGDVPASVRPGVYTLQIGVWNRGEGLRRRLVSRDQPRPIKRDAIVLQKVEIVDSARQDGARSKMAGG